MKKHRWPIAASLLVHSLIIGLVLGSVSFKAYKRPEGIHVDIVTNITDATGTAGPVAPASGTKESPYTQPTPHDRKKLKSKKQEPNRENRVVQETVPGKPVVDDSFQSAETNPIDPLTGSDDGQAEVPQPDLTGDQAQYGSQSDVEDGNVEPNFEGTESGFKTSSNNPVAGINGAREMNLFLQEVKTRLEKAKRYPWLARLNRQEGTVRLQFTIDGSGEAKNIHLIESSRWRLLNDEAVAVIKRVSRFPQPPNNTDVKVMIPLIFRLNVGENSQ